VNLDTNAIYSTLSLLLMFLGLVGAIIPVLPGPILIFAGAVIFAVGDNFTRIGIPTLIFLGVLTMLAYGSELALTTFFTRRVGATWKTVVGAIVGGLVGGVLGNAPVPILGALFGAALGAVIGVLVVERGLNRREWPEALRVSRNYLAGCLVGRLVELTLCIIMITIVAVQAAI
jgi:uncharacterized protein YqgC (DUF456 family)